MNSTVSVIMDRMYILFSEFAWTSKEICFIPMSITEIHLKSTSNWKYSLTFFLGLNEDNFNVSWNLCTISKWITFVMQKNIHIGTYGIPFSYRLFQFPDENCRILQIFFAIYYRWIPFLSLVSILLMFSKGGHSVLQNWIILGHVSNFYFQNNLLYPP